MAEPQRPPASTKPVLQKLRLKAGSRALVLNAPANYLDQFPSDVQVAQQLGDGPFDFVQVFVTRRDELLSTAPRVRPVVKPGGLVWISYPKGRSVPTDLNRDVVRLAAAEVGLEVVIQVAVDEVWSALRARVV